MKGGGAGIAPMFSKGNHTYLRAYSRTESSLKKLGKKWVPYHFSILSKKRKDNWLINKEKEKSPRGPAMVKKGSQDS